jgi:transcriptional regulator with XRE-family HTH domain
MTPRQKKTSHHIQMLMRSSPIARNQLAAISGLSNPYIRDLEAGNIANVGREKLIALAIALDLSLNEIDRMLNVFDRAALNHDDIDTFIKIMQKCRISSALHPVQDSFTLDLLLLSVELKPGPHVIVSPRPASCFRAEGHRLYAESDLIKAHPIYGDLVTTILHVRRRRMLINLNDHVVEQYVCERCLNDYILHCGDDIEKKWRVKHINNAIETIRSFENFRFTLIKECPSFTFVLKSHYEPTKDSEKLIITALPPHRMKVRTSGLLAGFATDNPSVISNFKKELQYIKVAVCDQYQDRDRLIDYLERLK